MERSGMGQQSQREDLASIYVRYRQSRRTEKQRILDEFMRVCGYHRKYAIGLLNRPLPVPRPRRRVRRAPHYSEAVMDMLAQLWAVSGYLCAVRLKAALPQWLPGLRRRIPLTSAQERQLLAISPRQVDRRLHTRKQRLKGTLYGTPRPGALLKHLIPIKTDHWDVTHPGYLAIDLVSHSGATAAGAFLYTLDCVDIQTGWVERQAVRGKGQQGIVQALTTIERHLPFALRGMDSDNGRACINDQVWAFGQRRSRPVQFTRSRPYKKDDNAHLEQKNWTHVRKLVGWERYDSLAALNALYRDLRLLQNLFQPSMKLLRKVRLGSRLIRRYAAPQTPWARVLASPEADAAKVTDLPRLLARTDPFVLSARLDVQLEQLWALARRAHQPRASVPTKPRPRAVTPWRSWTFSAKVKQDRQEQRQQIAVRR